MKSKMKYILVAENAIVDEKTQKLSVIGIFGNINIPPNTDKIALSFVVAGELFAENTVGVETGKLDINILNPDGSGLRSVSLQGPFEKNGKVQFTAFFNFVEFEQIGEYSVEALLDGELCTKDDKLCFFNVNKNG